MENSACLARVAVTLVDHAKWADENLGPHVDDVLVHNETAN